MPTYEYRCDQCAHEFSLVLSIAAHDTAKIACPACHSNQVTQQYSVFFAKTSKKS